MCCVWYQEKHISEVIETTNNFDKVTEEKIIQKMEVHIKNREDQLAQLRERLAEHVSNYEGVSHVYLVKYTFSSL